MVSYANVIGLVAAFISIGGIIPYTRSIIRGETVPNRATWWIWTLVGVLTLTSYKSTGADTTIWIAIGNAVCPILVALLSIKYGQGGWSRTDQWCLVLAVFSVIGWFTFDSVLLALSMHLCMDFVGSIPTLKKMWLHPRSENKAAWTMAFAGCVINMFAIQNWNLLILLHPMYHLICKTAILVLVWRKARVTNSDSPVTVLQEA